MTMTTLSVTAAPSGVLPNVETLTSPTILLLLMAVMATVILLCMAVMRELQAPAKRQSFDQALEIIAQSELDIDTALNKTEKTKRTWFEYWAFQAEESGKVIKDKQAPGRVVIGAMIFGALFGFLVLPGGPVGLLVPVVILAAFWGWFGAERRKRVIAMEKQLPQLLSGMRANLQAGATAQQAIISVADDLPAPLGDELRTLKRDLNVNVPLEDALKGLAERVPSREMQFLVASIEIAVRSGADLDPQLATIQGIVTQRTRIRQKLRAAVAQVKPTKLLAYAAVPLMFVVSVRDVENRAYWFGPGWYVLVGIVVLYASGGVVIRTMVRSVENS